MSYRLLLLHAPAGASEDEVEQIARLTTAEDRPQSGPQDPNIERRKRALVDALLAQCAELRGGEPDYAELARAEQIAEDDARDRFRWSTVSGPEEGAGIENTLYDDYVSVDMSSAGTDEDWEDVWRYLEILGREGRFVVWDPQAAGLVDLAAGPSGDGTRKTRAPAPKSQPGRSANDQDDERDVEPEAFGAVVRSPG